MADFADRLSILVAAIQYPGKVNNIWWLKAVDVVLGCLVAIHLGATVGSAAGTRLSERLIQGKGLFGLALALVVVVSIGYAMKMTVDALIAARISL